MFLKLFFIFFLNFTFLFNLNAHHPGNKIEAEIPYPKINIVVSRDKLEGYNLFFDLQNFKLSPEDIEIKNNNNRRKAASIAATRYCRVRPRFKW